MDRKKRVDLPPSENLLYSEFADTPYGEVCVAIEVVCLKCCAKHKISINEEALERVDSASQTGTAIIDEVLADRGWVRTLIRRKNGPLAMYSVCPDCVEDDFQAYLESVR